MDSNTDIHIRVCIGRMPPGDDIMDCREDAAERLGALFPDGGFIDRAKDPEMARIFYDFALGEVQNRGAVDERTGMIAVLSSLIGCQGIDLFEAMVPAALRTGVTPVEIREIVYQSTAYMGMGRTLPFIAALDRALEAQGIALPLEDQTTVDYADRTETGEATQVEIFGEGMRGFHSSGPEETRHINLWLSANCFGDYYTRGGLDNRMRELVTFCLLAAQGGCEPQLTAHAAGNMSVGNDRVFLIEVVSYCLPYIGYPRSLNAIACIDKAAGKS